MITRRTTTRAKQKSIDLRHYRERQKMRAERKRDAELAARTRVPGTTYVRTEPKVGRNSPCPCNSESKFKRCCGRRQI